MLSPSTILIWSSNGETCQLRMRQNSCWVAQPSPHLLLPAHHSCLLSLCGSMLSLTFIFWLIFLLFLLFFSSLAKISSTCILAFLTDSYTTKQHHYPRIPVPAFTTFAFPSCLFIWPAGLNSAMPVSFSLTPRDWELLCSMENLLKDLLAWLCSLVPESSVSGEPVD